jgi:eukaryotic-like serine/threonine-protein kinase
MAIHASKDVIADRYRIVEYRAAGGMQEVYSATDMVLDRRVALKTPFNTSGEKRFARSASLSARINHPNAARTFDYLVDNQRQYLIEEFIDGHSLDALLDEIPQFDPDAAAWVLHHLARGLAAVHRHNIVHRDLKPGNIMVLGGWGFTGLKITDFGVAQMAAHEIEEAARLGTVTTSKTAIGALPYMAPEVIESPTTPEPPADIWAVGALGYQLLTGDLPFGQGFAAVTRIQAAAPPPMPQALQLHPQFRHLGRELYGVLLQCLQRDVRQRPDALQLVELCDRLCYSLVEERRIGVVEGYPGRSFGFLRPKRGGEPIFFHTESVVSRLPMVGQEAWFRSYAGQPRDRAHPVVPKRAQ